MPGSVHADETPTSDVRGLHVQRPWFPKAMETTDEMTSRELGLAISRELGRKPWRFASLGMWPRHSVNHMQQATYAIPGVVLLSGEYQQPYTFEKNQFFLLEKLVL